MMKRVRVYLLLAVLGIALCGCRNKTNQAESPKPGMRYPDIFILVCRVVQS